MKCRPVRCGRGWSIAAARSSWAFRMIATCVIPIILLAKDCGVRAAEPAGPAVSVPSPPNEIAEQSISFGRDVWPILNRHCVRCHHHEDPASGLAMNFAEGWRSPTDSGEPLIVPGRPEQSYLLIRMHDEDAGDVMPPDGQPLSIEERQVIHRWVRDGGTIPNDFDGRKHWAYQPVKRANVPPVQWPDQVSNPIDVWLNEELRRLGLPANDRANEMRLRRRLSLVLTGLPADQTALGEATPDELHLTNGPASRSELMTHVDRLLASPQFGVHWARHWLDLARYSDSNGFQADQLRDSWAYRDWIIRSLNADMPMDEFIIKQLAGDLLPDATVDDRIATGFHRTATCNVEAGVDPEANRTNQVFDRVNTTGTVFLGTTVSCAQCHDHKYDPITQRDYYRLFAYFNNTPLEVQKTAGVTFDFTGPSMELPIAPEQDRLRRRLIDQRRQLEKKRRAIANASSRDRWWRRVRESLETNAADWFTPRADFATSGPSTNRRQPDGSFLIGGEVPRGSVTYTWTFRVDEVPAGGDEALPISALRLEALRDPGLPGMGPGRGDPVRTNFVANELTLHIGDRPRSLATASASFSQTGYAVKQLIDGDPKTGWAIAPQFDRSHEAVVTLEQPVSVDDRLWTVRVTQSFGSGRVIGRPRLSLLRGEDPLIGVSEEDRDWLRQQHTKSIDDASPKDWEAQHRRRLQTIFEKASPQFSAIDHDIASFDKRLDAIDVPTTLVMTETSPRTTRMLGRGDYLQPGEEVTAGTPESLPKLGDFADDRLGLAQWLTHPDHPLTARVMVNRIWNEVFGQGIVTTPEDFGTQSEPPSHPELLDHLATRLVENRWSLKRLIREMVSSDAFLRKSSLREAAAFHDPQNRFLSAGPKYRLPAESIRDQSISLAGLLAARTEGAPIMPYQPDGVWRAVGRNQPKWRAALDSDRYRRGLFVVHKRSAPYPSYVVFDGPDRGECVVRRSRTNTPLQALALMNDRAACEAALGLAQTMARIARDAAESSPTKTTASQKVSSGNIQSGEPASDDAILTAITRSFERATGTEPSDEQLQTLRDLHRASIGVFQSDPQAAQSLVGLLPRTFRDPELDTIEVAAWFPVAQAIFNLDLCITIH